MDSLYSRARRLGRALLLTLAVVALATAADAQQLGRSLQNALSVAAPADLLEVIVTFEGEGPLTVQQRAALSGLGLGGVLMNNLPIAGVVATPAQINQIVGLPGVRSVWHNDALQYENDGPTALTGVDRLRTDSSLRNALGMPFSGRGIGVLVNDSGVDGTHPDIKYPDHVVQNVLAQTNLHSLSDLLPVTYTEGVANTDIGGGHGTHVAGIIGATDDGTGMVGVAPGVRIHSLDVFDGSGTASMSRLIQAMDHVLAARRASAARLFLKIG